jgi:hypothetical protein
MTITPRNLTSEADFIAAEREITSLNREFKKSGADNVTYVEMAIAEDLVRFVPELAPLLAEALAVGRAACYEDDEGGAA